MYVPEIIFIEFIREFNHNKCEHGFVYADKVYFKTNFANLPIGTIDLLFCLKLNIVQDKKNIPVSTKKCLKVINFVFEFSRL